MRYDLGIKRAPSELQLLIAMLNDGTRESRGELGKVAKKAIVWQVREGGQSIGAELLHSMDAEGWWIEEVAKGGRRSKEEVAELLSEATKVDEGIWPTPPAKPLSWYYERQDTIRARTIRTLRKLADMAKTSGYKGRKNEYEFSLRWIVSHIIHHEAYHFGQAVLIKSLWGNRQH